MTPYAYTSPLGAEIPGNYGHSGGFKRLGRPIFARFSQTGLMHTVIYLCCGFHTFFPPGRTAQAKAFAPLLVLSVFTVRHALKTLFIHTATRCFAGRPSYWGRVPDCLTLLPDTVAPFEFWAVCSLLLLRPCLAVPNVCPNSSVVVCPQQSIAVVEGV